MSTPFLLNHNHSLHSITLSTPIETAVTLLAESLETRPYLRRGLGGSVTATFVNLDNLNAVHEARFSAEGALLELRGIVADRYGRGVWQHLDDEDLWAPDHVGERPTGPRLSHNPNTRQSTTLNLLRNSSQYFTSTRADDKGRIEILAVHRTDIRLMKLVLNERGSVSAAHTLGMGGVDALAWTWVRLAYEARQVIGEVGLN